jgi:hypothetical protein
MPRPSSIDRLPSDIREKIGELRRGGLTYDEILRHLGEMLPASDMPSRSALGRHLAEFEAAAEEMRRQDAITKALMAQFGDANDGRMLRLNIALAQGVLSKIAFAENGTLARLDPEEAMFVARAIQSLASASKADTDREQKIRDRAVTEAKAAAAAAVDKVAKSAGGLTRETVAALKAEFLGIK